MALVENRFLGKRAVYPDEPEAALPRQGSFPSGDAATSLAQPQLASLSLQRTHSPILMAYPDADIFVLDEHGIEKDDVRANRALLFITKYLNHPQRMLDELLYTENRENKGKLIYSARRILEIYFFRFAFFAVGERLAIYKKCVILSFINIFFNELRSRAHNEKIKQATLEWKLRKGYGFK